MSFETWWKDYCRNHDSTPSFGTVFEAGRAESEAQIATLQARIAELERELDATKTAASGEPARKP